MSPEFRKWGFHFRVLMSFNYVSGPSDESWELRKLWWERLLQIRGLEPMEPEKKTFTPKNPEVPKLKDYAKPPPDWYWDLFPENNQKGATSKIDGNKLRTMALECGYSDMAKLNKIVGNINNGAKIGCQGPCRRPTIAKNTTGCYEDGYKISDAICSWIKKGFVMGPVNMSDVPEDAKFSSLMTRPKPNGSCRIILNLSAPKKRSVNDGIKKSEFPAKMSSTTAWLRVLKKAGRNSYIVKVDWSDAYKHIPVHQEDLDLQWFQWLGKAFVELCLIFGSVSSPGIFDELAKLILFIVLSKSGFPKDMVIQHLDDICAAMSGAQVERLQKFDDIFFEVAQELGLELAPRTDPEKSFGPSQKGTVLGVEYDTVNWTWGIPSDKLARLQISLRKAILADNIQQDEIWSLVGKIIHVRPLIPGGKFNIDHLLQANSHSTDRTSMVPVTEGLRRQLSFWYDVLPLCTHKVSIPDPDPCTAPWAVECWTDAAGGTRNSTWHGVGAVTTSWWAYAPWGSRINTGQDAGKGRSLARVMSALELLGPLLTISAGFQWCRQTPVVTWVDNAASVHIWDKGYSTACQLSNTIVKAMNTVATAIGCTLEVKKITRCSSPGATMADALSKGHFMRFWSEARKEPDFALPLEKAWVPKQLLSWIMDPKEDEWLGDRIVEEISPFVQVMKPYLE